MNPPDLVRCTYSSCPETFPSEKAMKKHKFLDPTHFYCKRCDEDFLDDEAITVHKLKSTRHITCPVCAKEFGSEGGRDCHVREDHRAANNIPCVGCRTKFKSASGLMAHLERNECYKIPNARLQQEQAKRLLTIEALRRMDQEDLLPLSDEQHKEQYRRGLEAMQHQPRIGAEENPKAAEHWPTLSDAGARSAKSRALSAGAGEYPDMSGLSQSSDEGEGVALPWAASSRFVGPPLTEGSDSDPGTLLRQIMNWNPRNFFDTVTAEYKCPTCMKCYTSVKAFEGHIVEESSKISMLECPGCQKKFKSKAALAAHCESLSKRCSVNSMEWFNEFIGIFSGGLIKANGRHEDDSVRLEAGDGVSALLMEQDARMMR